MLEKVPAHRATDWWPGLFQPLRSLGNRIHDFFAPDAEACATETDYEVKIELPGVKEEDIDISLENNVLTVKGEKRSEIEETGKSFYFSERTYGSFQRAFQLPGTVKSGDIKADFKDGVLAIKLPKLEEPKSRGQKIVINN